MMKQTIFGFGRGLGLCLGLLVLAPCGARAQEVTESSTGQRFAATLNYGGKGYSLLGVGVRKKFVVKVYAMGLYGESTGAKQAYPALAGKGGGDKVQQFVVYGRFAKLAVLRFVRDVDKDKIQEAYRESLGPALAAGGALQADAQAFLALFDKDVKSGQELRIATDEGGKVTVEIAGQKKSGPQSPQLSRAIWEIWLGSKPISTDMRKTLVERVDELGK